MSKQAWMLPNSASRNHPGRIKRLRRPPQTKGKTIVTFTIFEPSEGASLHQYITAEALHCMSGAMHAKHGSSKSRYLTMSWYKASVCQQLKRLGVTSHVSSIVTVLSFQMSVHEVPCL